MKRSIYRTLLMGTALAALIGTVAAPPANAYDGHRDRHVVRRAPVIVRDRHWHDWHDRGRVYYGDRVYVDPPPAVYYAPPPPPSGLNLMFSFGR
jgi:hypothetical protein